ncbi:hypothetical protein SELMODRAFT_423258 [Selaginella moellendorffii]|uniref:Uncharacterized protein n=1 Tax=Selaginella moellendorffii TaxID=88036 RepID=D8SL33_SELML|nr:hypothetical protein SELMODRAFT_423258 [Selaginella moellendorffii]
MQALVSLMKSPGQVIDLQTLQKSADRFKDHYSWLVQKIAGPGRSGQRRGCQRPRVGRSLALNVDYSIAGAYPPLSCPYWANAARRNPKLLQIPGISNSAQEQQLRLPRAPAERMISLLGLELRIALCSLPNSSINWTPEARGAPLPTRQTYDTQTAEKSKNSAGRRSVPEDQRCRRVQQHFELAGMCILEEIRRGVPDAIAVEDHAANLGAQLVLELEPVVGQPGLHQRPLQRPLPSRDGGLESFGRIPRSPHILLYHS